MRLKTKRVIVFILLNLFDYLTTALIIFLGGHELNPFILLFGTPTSFPASILKLLLMPLIVIFSSIHV